jgi:hypothetical protein
MGVGALGVVSFDEGEEKAKSQTFFNAAGERFHPCAGSGEDPCAAKKMRVSSGPSPERQPRFESPNARLAAGPLALDERTWIVLTDCARRPSASKKTRPAHDFALFLSTDAGVDATRRYRLRSFDPR